MATIIKVDQKDNLKIIKSRQLAPLNQVHKNKKAYLMRTKHKKLDY
jgi:hypothetical protein